MESEKKKPSADFVVATKSSNSVYNITLVTIRSDMVVVRFRAGCVDSIYSVGNTFFNCLLYVVYSVDNKNVII